MFLQKDSPQFDHPAPWGHSLKDLAAMQETLYSTEHLSHMSVWTWVSWTIVQCVSGTCGWVHSKCKVALCHRWSAQTGAFQLLITHSKLYTYYMKVQCCGQYPVCADTGSLEYPPTHTYAHKQCTTRGTMPASMCLPINLMASNTLYCANFFLGNREMLTST